MKTFLFTAGLVLSIPLVFAGGLFFFVFHGYKMQDRNIAHYLSRGQKIDTFAVDVLPDLDSLPEYEKINYQYYIHRYIFMTETVLLVVMYDQPTYEAEKEKLDETYTFLDHAVLSGYGFLIPKYEFSINTYEFRIVEEEGSDHIRYPKHFGLIATSDEKNSIAYMYFADQDLDHISIDGEEEPMKKFVKKYFKYRW